MAKINTTSLFRPINRISASQLRALLMQQCLLPLMVCSCSAVRQLHSTLCEPVPVRPALCQPITAWDYSVSNNLRPAVKSLERSSCGRQAGPGKVQLTAAAVSRKIAKQARYQNCSELELRVDQCCIDSVRLSRKSPLELLHREVKGGRLPGRQGRLKQTWV